MIRVLLHLLPVVSNRTIRRRLEAMMSRTVRGPFRMGQLALQMGHEQKKLAGTIGIRCRVEQAMLQG